MTPPAVAIAQQFQRKANTMNTEEITGLILAGGRGTRMGHVDKGLQNFRGGRMNCRVTPGRWPACRRV
jgi:hypothetical protein